MRSSRFGRHAIVAALGLGLVLSACSSPGQGDESDQATPGGDLVIALAGDPGVLNPDTPGYSTGSIETARSIFDTLVGYNAKWDIIPGLAESWDVSEDAKTVTFHLAAGVTWHDGEPFSSQDVKFTYEAILRDKGWAVDYLSDVASIETPDDVTVVIKLSQPNASFVQTLGEQGLSILPEHLLAGEDWTDSAFNIAPVGTGPFKFEEYSTGSHILLSANEDYFQGRPIVDQLMFKILPDQASALTALESGEIQFSTNFAPPGEVDRLDASPNVRVTYYTYPTIAYQAYNLAEAGPLQDPKVREAIALGTDRDGINDRAQNGLATVADHLYLSGHWATDESIELPGYDPDKANEILDAAGYERDANGTRFSLGYLIYTGYGIEGVADVVKQQMREIGIDIEIDALEWGSYVTKGKDEKDFDVMFGMGYAGPDPALLGVFVGTGGFQNSMSYSNPEVDNLLDEAVKVPGHEERAEIYSEIQQILLDDMPRLPLFDRKVPFPVAETCHDFWPEDSEAALSQAERSYWKVWCSS